VKEVVLYTDGACKSNPGPGGYGVVLIDGERRQELCGGYRLTTNSRMELMAAIKGLEALAEPCKVRLYSDSEYLVRAMNKGWPQRWKRRGWQRSDKQPASNPDLWERLMALCQTHQVAFIWVKGHAGDLENERCDQLSTQAAQMPDLPPDEGYESPPWLNPQQKLF
jgi:ribonuclease HI